MPPNEKGPKQACVKGAFQARDPRLPLPHEYIAALHFISVRISVNDVFFISIFFSPRLAYFLVTRTSRGACNRKRAAQLTRLSPSPPSHLAVELRESADAKQKEKTTMQAVDKDNTVTYEQKFNL